jgi:hypothetical protein
MQHLRPQSSEGYPVVSDEVYGVLPNGDSEMVIKSEVLQRK